MRWSWCNNNRNKVHNKCNGIESSPNHPSTPICGNIVFHVTGPWCQNVGNRCGLTRISLIPHTVASGNYSTLCFYEYRFFYIPHLCGITQCLSFPLWLFCLSKIPSSSIHVAANSRIGLSMHMNLVASLILKKNKKTKKTRVAFEMEYDDLWASLVAQSVQNPPAMQET